MIVVSFLKNPGVLPRGHADNVSLVAQSMGTEPRPALWYPYETSPPTSIS